MRNASLSTRLFAAATALASITPAGAFADEASASCAIPGWNMSRELTLFDSKPLPLVASGAPTSAPRIETEKLYVLKLLPQTSVQFAAPPGKQSDAPDAHAGLVQFSVKRSGDYRVTIDGPFWIDVVTGANLIKSNAFKGRHDCKLFHKSVEFTLSESQMLTLQLSGAESDTVRVTITPAVKAA